MAKNLVFDSFAPNLDPKAFFSQILLLQDVRICCKLSLYGISRKTNESNLRKLQKTLFRAPTIVFRIFNLFQMFCKLSLYEILRKTNKPNLRKQLKTQFWPDFGPFCSNLDPNVFFREFYLYQMLDIVASYHCMQFQGKLMN